MSHSPFTPGGAVGEERPTLFLRTASRIVPGWSVRDAVIYACLSTNVITLGLIGFAHQQALTAGQMMNAVLMAGVGVSFLVVAYSGLIVTIPRSGGDYVWQTRILGGGIGFVMSVTGHWFILWLWAPIYGTVLSEELFQPLWATFGRASGADWFASPTGVFVVTLITIALAGLLVSLGMSGYAKVQRWCLVGGLAGLAIMAGLLLMNGRSGFAAAFDAETHRIWGVTGAYNGTLAAARKGGLAGAVSGAPGPAGASMMAVPMLLFYLLRPNWGATLYGEIRGAGDFKRVFGGMFAGLWITVIMSVVLLALFARTFGYAFYAGANSDWLRGSGVLPVFPYPVMMAGWLVHNTAFQAILILLMSLWFFGWTGTLFLSSTRVIFAAAFDRILPEGAARVSEKHRVPVWSLVLMLLPAAGLGALYAYDSAFRSYTLDAILVIAVTYLFSAIAVVILPWRKPALWRASPASRIKVAGIPVVPASGLITIGLLGFSLYEWLSKPGYGVNEGGSLIFMASLYVLALAIYAGARAIRRRQGIDLSLVNSEIPRHVRRRM